MTIPPAWRERKLLADLRWQAALTRACATGDPADLRTAAQALAEALDAQLLLDICAGLPAEPLGTTPDTH